jgi:hypothetical protein
MTVGPISTNPTSLADLDRLFAEQTARLRQNVTVTGQPYDAIQRTADATQGTQDTLSVSDGTQQAQAQAGTATGDPTVTALNGSVIAPAQVTDQLLAEQDLQAIALSQAQDASQQQAQQSLVSADQALRGDQDVDFSQQMLASQAMRPPIAPSLEAFVAQQQALDPISAIQASLESQPAVAGGDGSPLDLSA